MAESIIDGTIDSEVVIEELSTNDYKQLWIAE
jgi:hypothetical protein